MRYIRRFKENNIEELIEFFYKRTKLHIDLTKKYGLKILSTNLCDSLDTDEIMHEIMNHDESKYNEPEFTPYVHLSWYYKCKKEGIDYQYPVGMEKQVNEVTLKHIMNNKHHPEYWCDPEEVNLNTDDRDKPSGKPMNAYMMPFEHIVCMCADWMAMSDEKGTCPIEWANNNVNVRWLFTEGQEELIYNILEEVWK